jgi:nucleotide-binding universal stress UspA family protein
MVKVRRILFPTDFSEHSRHALPYAVKLAQEHRAELHLLHAIVLHEEDPYDEAHHLPDAARIRDIMEEVARKRMGELVKDQDLPDLVLTQVHRRDVSAAPPIVEYARNEGIDLIVLGTHGRRGFRRLILGSVAAEVFRLAPSPVLAIRAETPPAGEHEIRRILVPLDFSNPGTRALVRAGEIASFYRAEIQLLHVLEEFLHPAFYNLGATSLKDFDPDIVGRTESAMRELVASLWKSNGPAIRYSVAEGPPSREILLFAQEEESDLVVMATHGLRGVKDFLLGSTTERVLGGARVPVLALREPTSQEPGSL